MSEVKDLTQAKNTTESLISALTEWVAIQRLKQLNEQVANNPLSFKEGFSAERIREVNRS